MGAPVGGTDQSLWTGRRDRFGKGGDEADDSFDLVGEVDVESEIVDLCSHPPDLTQRANGSGRDHDHFR